MTIERDQDPEPTVQMPRPVLPVVVDEELEDADPDQTVARDDWESTVIRRVAPRVAQVREEVESDDDRYGWENEGLRRLSRELQSKQVRGEG